MSQVQYSTDDEDALYNTLLGTQMDGESVETEYINYNENPEGNSFMYGRPEYKMPEYNFSFNNAGSDGYQMPQQNNPDWFQGYQTNPSEVDKDLAGGPNYAWNSGGGQNWRQGY